MYVLITYDVSTSDPAGAKRLRRVARICTNYGQRVQNSVFECLVDPAQMVLLYQSLLEAIDPEQDSIRFYELGKNYRQHIKMIGKITSYNIEDELII